MDKTQQEMQKKKRQFYITTAITTILVLAVVSIGVLIAYEVPWKYDMTMERIFTLSEQSVTMIEKLETPIEIAAIYPKGKEEMLVQSLLEEYLKVSKKISVEYIDMEKDPSGLSQYQLDVPSVANGTLIVKGAERTKIIDGASLFQTTQEGGNTFAGEREITGAIRYVTTTNMPVVYFVQGHDEAAPSKEMTKATSTLQLDAYEVKTLSLLKENAVPKDASVLVLASPKEDITKEEQAMIETYLKQGGKMMLMVDSVMNSNHIVLENINAITNTYGIDISNNYVVEEDKEFYLSTYQMYLIPRYGPHEITQKIGEDKKLVVLPVVRGLGSVPYDKDRVTRSPLLVSSQKSWARGDMNITDKGYTKEDKKGPISLAYSAVGSNVKAGMDASRLVVIGNSSFAYDGNIEAQANQALWSNSINWLNGDRNSDIIAGKMIGADRLMIRGNDFMKLMIICIFVMPMIAFICALVVWKIRRNQ